MTMGEREEESRLFESLLTRSYYLRFEGERRVFCLSTRGLAIEGELWQRGKCQCRGAKL